MKRNKYLKELKKKENNFEPILLYLNKLLLNVRV